MEQKPLYQLDTRDIAAVANSRFFRNSGLKMLILVAAYLLALSTIFTYMPVVIGVLMPPVLYYLLLTAGSIVFVYIYSKKQAEVRMQLMQAIDQHRKEQEEHERQLRAKG